MSISPELGEPRQVELEAGTIRYREHGKGDVLLFVNGVFVTGDFWRGVAPPLAAGHRCICPDWPLGAHEVPMRRGADLTFHGIVRLIVDFIDALGIERATLVGNDTGTAYCLQAAIDHPDRFERLVLTSGDALEIYPPRVVQWLKAVAYVPGLTHVTLPLVGFRPVRRLPSAYGWVAKRPFPARSPTATSVPRSRARRCAGTSSRSSATPARATPRPLPLAPTSTPRRS